MEYILWNCPRDIWTQVLGNIWFGSGSPKCGNFAVFLGVSRDTHLAATCRVESIDGVLLRTVDSKAERDGVALHHAQSPTAWLAWLQGP